MQIFLLSLVFLTLAALYYNSFLQTGLDAKAGPSSLSQSEWLKHSIVSMAFCLAVFIAICFGVNVDFIIKASEQGTNSEGQATLVTIGGAIATGTAIYKGVQIAIIPFFNLVTGAKTARKKLREKVKSTVN